MTKQEALANYYTAKKDASTKCGSCRSLRCSYCNEIRKWWNLFLDLELTGKDCSEEN